MKTSPTVRNMTIDQLEAFIIAVINYTKPGASCGDAIHLSNLKSSIPQAPFKAQPTEQLHIDLANLKQKNAFLQRLVETHEAERKEQDKQHAKTLTRMLELEEQAKGQYDVNELEGRLSQTVKELNYIKAELANAQLLLEQKDQQLNQIKLTFTNPSFFNPDDI